jgi:mannose-6-phosphate isomerase
MMPTKRQNKPRTVNFFIGTGNLFADKLTKQVNFKEQIITFPQNRVWRSYPGGKVLDQLAGKSHPADTHFPEDWIGSFTAAKNPGREHIQEGRSHVFLGERFDKVIESDPEYFLGKEHVEAFGPQLKLLVKLLDSAVRLHFQCHPTAQFARERMGEPSGKAEAYYILAIREEVENPYVHIGFQRPPGKEDLKKWIEEQDLASIEGCFDKIPVKPGDTLFIPGGYPHAIGEGILMVEIMEPSDLAVRFEFEKAGYTLPEESRFMGRGIDFAMEVFDFSASPMEAVREKTFFAPTKIRDYPDDAGSQYHLIGPETTPCMQVRKSVLTGPVRKDEDQCFIGIVTKGQVKLSKGDSSRKVETYGKFFYPAGEDSLVIEPVGEAEILECYPPRPSKD